MGLIIYLVGCVLAAVFIYAVSKQNGDDIDIESILIALLMIVCSWFTVVFMVYLYLKDWYEDHKYDIIISFKKRHENKN